MEKCLITRLDTNFGANLLPKFGHLVLEVSNNSEISFDSTQGIPISIQNGHFERPLGTNIGTSAVTTNVASTYVIANGQDMPVVDFNDDFSLKSLDIRHVTASVAQFNIRWTVGREMTRLNFLNNSKIEGDANDLYDMPLNFLNLGSSNEITGEFHNSIRPVQDFWLFTWPRENRFDIGKYFIRYMQKSSDNCTIHIAGQCNMRIADANFNDIATTSLSSTHKVVASKLGNIITVTPTDLVSWPFQSSITYNMATGEWTTE